MIAQLKITSVEPSEDIVRVAMEHLQDTFNGTPLRVIPGISEENQEKTQITGFRTRGFPALHDLIILTGTMAANAHTVLSQAHVVQKTLDALRATVSHFHSNIEFQVHLPEGPTFTIKGDNLRDTTSQQYLEFCKEICAKWSAVGS